MPQVSKRKLQPEIQDRLIELLITVLSATNQTKSGILFTHSFLSTTERNMLAKRVGIALLLKRKYSYFQIMDYLKVSKGTIAKVSELLNTCEPESKVYPFVNTLNRLV
ncbi:MAG: Trp family transcriptional regulator [bacterium]